MHANSVITEDTLYSSFNIPGVHWQRCSDFMLRRKKSTFANEQHFKAPIHGRKLDLVPFLSLTPVFSFPCFLLYPGSLSSTVSGTVSLWKFNRKNLTIIGTYIYVDFDKTPRLLLFVLTNNMTIYVIKMEGTMLVGTGNEARPISNSQYIYIYIYFTNSSCTIWSSEQN